MAIWNRQNDIGVNVFLSNEELMQLGVLLQKLKGVQEGRAVILNAAHGNDAGRFVKFFDNAEFSGVGERGKLEK